MAKFITTTLMDSYVGGPHITETQIGLANQATFGPDDYVLGGGRESEAQVLTNNSIRIFDAVYCIQGRRDVIPASEYTDVTIANGTQGMNRNDIIVRRYEKDESSEIESTEYAVIKGIPNAGEALDPEVTIGDIRTGATLHEMKLYRVKIEGLNITAVEPLFNILKNMAVLQQEIAQTNKDLSNRIAESFKCELTQLTAKAFRAVPKATAMRLDEQYDYSDFKMIGFCVINMSTSDSVTHRQWQWLPTQWLQDNLLNQSSSSSYANRRLIFNFSRGGGGQRVWIYGSTNDGLNFIKGSNDTDDYDCVMFGLR